MSLLVCQHEMRLIVDPITSLVQSEDAQTMLVSSLDDTIRLLDKANGGLLNSFSGHQNSTYRVPSVFGHTQRIVVSGSEHGEIVAWDIANGKEVGRIHAHGGKVISGVTFHPRSCRMISCGQDGSISLWSV